MRTKALLLGALCAIGLAAYTSTAQVYSVNIVGYVNLTVSPGWTMIQNPLECKLAGGNVMNNIWPAPPQNIAVYRWRPDLVPPQYLINNYDTGFGWDDGDITTYRPGEAFYVYNPGAAFNVTFVGEVLTGTIDRPVYRGWNMVGSAVPQRGTMQTDLNYIPGPDPEAIYIWDPTASPPQYYITSWDSGFGWDPEEPILEVGKGAYLYRTTVAPGNWQRQFNIQ